MKEFDWIESNEHEDIGMIAQQLKEVLPDLIYQDEETDKMSIKTDKFIPYLIKAIQELSQVINKFDSLPKLNLLGNKLNTLNVSDNNESADKVDKWQDKYTVSDKQEFVKKYSKSHIKPKVIEYEKVTIPK